MMAFRWEVSVLFMVLMELEMISCIGCVEREASGEAGLQKGWIMSY